MEGFCVRAAGLPVEVKERLRCQLERTAADNPSWERLADALDRLIDCRPSVFATIDVMAFCDGQTILRVELKAAAVW